MFELWTHTETTACTIQNTIQEEPTWVGQSLTTKGTGLVCTRAFSMPQPVSEKQSFGVNEQHNEKILHQTEIQAPG